MGTLTFKGRPTSINLPNEIIQNIYDLLHPIDFNAARYTCRLWFRASLNRKVLIEMLKRGGWWCSFLQILAPLSINRIVHLQQERIMSKWITRECNLANPKKSTFIEIGYTDFSGLIHGPKSGDLHGELTFTSSLCGRFILVTAGKTIYIYELNHACSESKASWAISERSKRSLPLGSLRPLTSIICPRQIMSCTMDTSAGRNAVGILMEGRLGMVCDITAERMEMSKASPANASGEDSGLETQDSVTNDPLTCVCLEKPVSNGIPTEGGPRSVYRNICHADDPPRSVALCPWRNCIAFGCTAGIELH